jgi:hypothetical protein
MSSITSINGVNFYFCPLSKLAFQVAEISSVKMIEGVRYLNENETEPVDILQIKLKDGELIYLADCKGCEVANKNNYYTVAYCAPSLFYGIAYTFKFEYKKFGCD